MSTVAFEEVGPEVTEIVDAAFDDMADAVRFHEFGEHEKALKIMMVQVTLLCDALVEASKRVVVMRSAGDA